MKLRNTQQSVDYLRATETNAPGEGRDFCGTRCRGSCPVVAQSVVTQELERRNRTTNTPSVES